MFANKTSCLFTGSVLTASFLLSGVPVFAASDKSIRGSVEAIEADIAQIKTEVAEIGTDIGQIETDVGQLQSDVSALVTTYDVEVAVETDACLRAFVQCNAVGAAGDGNEIAIRVAVSVSQNGVPVSGLTADDISFGGTFVPAGGSGPTFCDDGSCDPGFFLDSGGVYQIFVVPGVVWRTGSYFNQVLVDDGAGYGAALMTFSVP
jgi:hypothetical protein